MRVAVRDAGATVHSWPSLANRIWSLDAHANAPLGSIYSFQMVGGATGMALGGWLGGSLFAMAGAYSWSWLRGRRSRYVTVALTVALTSAALAAPTA